MTSKNIFRIYNEVIDIGGTDSSTLGNDINLINMYCTQTLAIITGTSVTITSPTVTVSASTALNINSGGTRITGGVTIFTGGLVVSGGLIVSGGITVNDRGIFASPGVTTSDIRLKTDIVPLPNPLLKVSKLRGVYFSWVQNNDDGVIYDDRRHVGVLAQDVQQVLPEVVDEIQGGKYLGVDYPALIPLLIEAIRELDARTTAMNLKLDHLENRLETTDRLRAI
jgi:hypothetical protein